jgi:hypothetical protein
MSTHDDPLRGPLLEARCLFAYALPCVLGRAHLTAAAASAAAHAWAALRVVGARWRTGFVLGWCVHRTVTRVGATVGHAITSNSSVNGAARVGAGLGARVRADGLPLVEANDRPAPLGGDGYNDQETAHTAMVAPLRDKPQHELADASWLGVAGRSTPSQLHGAHWHVIALNATPSSAGAHCVQSWCSPSLAVHPASALSKRQ